MLCREHGLGLWPKLALLTMHPTPIYLDHNATTPLDPEVLEAMRPYLLAAGNAESRHSFGRSARRAWERAKETVGADPGGRPDRGDLHVGWDRGQQPGDLRPGRRGDHRPGHVVTSPIEHPAVAEPIARLEAAGFAVDRVPVDGQGLADASRMAATFRDDTRFATLMLANNETGAIQPVDKLAALARRRGIPVHTDAVQAVGRIPVHFHDLGVTTLAASAHKFHGPVGIGLLLVESGVRLARGCSAAASSKGGGRGPSRSRWRSDWRRPSRSGTTSRRHDLALDGAARPSRSRPDRRIGARSRHPQRARCETSCDSPRRSTSASPASTATPC